MTPTQAQLFQPEIAVHVTAALISLSLGAYVLFGRKGTPLHRIAGRIWVAAMVITAASSFFIEGRVLTLATPWGRFGPIHLLSVAMLWLLLRAIGAIRTGDVLGHRVRMKGAYLSLAIAGLFTLAPARTLGAWLSSWLA